jgi:IclR family transcriptional regulator, pca regulon regulatory protein
MIDVATEDALPRHHVRSLGRGLAVLRSFNEEHQRLTLSDVARTTGMTRAAARRFLLTLVDLGYVRVEDHRFELTPQVLELGYAYLSSVPLPRLAPRHLEDLSRAVQESASVSVLADGDIVYVARVETSRIMRIDLDIGTRLPAPVTSMGRVLLAELPAEDLDRHLAPHGLGEHGDGQEREVLLRTLAQVAAEGYALVDQELEPGLRSIAVPIRMPSGRVDAACNVSTHTNRVSIEELRSRILPRLRDAAAAIERDLSLSGRR